MHGQQNTKKSFFVSGHVIPVLNLFPFQYLALDF